MTVRDDLRQRLEACLAKLKWHTDLVREYDDWRQRLRAHPEARLALDADDWLYFFGAA